ncbi:MAG TPA: hypothetical protein PKW29_01665 [Clostridia bacterium]|nr:hypothetical protein [Clostridia bacterium]
MNLDDFEQHIEPAILKRGRDYYKSGAVVSLREMGDGVYQAEVRGSETYTVDVELDGQGGVAYTVCDCPYNLGAYCKHQAAALLALRALKEGKAEGGQAKAMRGGTAKPRPASREKNSLRADITELLGGQNKEDPIRLVCEIASEHTEIARRIKPRLGARDAKDEVRNAAALIRACVKRNADQDGFVDYDRMGDALAGADQVLDGARELADAEQPLRAAALALCAIREVTVLLDGSDDSDGYVGDTVECAFDLIRKAACAQSLSPVEREKLFELLSGESALPVYRNESEKRLALLQACAELVLHEPALRARLEETLTSMRDAIKRSAWDREYFEEQLEMIRYRMIEKLDGEDRAAAFIRERLGYSKFRQIAIESAIGSGAYAEAVGLALAGEEQDQDKPGIITRWKEYRFQAYRLAGNIEELRKLAVDFILGGSFPHYHELKKTYGTAEWLNIYPGVIRSLEDAQRTGLSVYADILIEEGEKQKLLEYVERDASRVTRFYRHLLPEHRDAVFAIFRRYIELAAQRAGTRNDYRTVCAIIRNLKKAGGREQAEAVRRALAEKYPKKPAFLDELSRV